MPDEAEERINVARSAPLPSDSLHSTMSSARHPVSLIVAAGRPVMATVTGGLLALLALACGAPPAAPVPIESPPTPAPAMAPPPPRPAADGPCRYLSAAAVQATNGERVSAVRVSETSPEEPYPACFFLAAGGAVQLRTWIVVATPEVARATVDAVAPVAISDLAQLPGGWSGGSQPTADGAVFAVSRRSTAVVVTTNQHQTVSARQIAAQVIAALGL